MAWVPLLLLSALHGDAFGDAVPIPFIEDIETHVRFLIALPILIAAEIVVHRRIRFAVNQFVERGIVAPEHLSQFRSAIDSTMRLRNSPAIELALLAVEIAHEVTSWYASGDGTQIRITPAGYWNVFVSVPIFQFVLLRWYFRFFLWFWFLFRVSRLRPIFHAGRDLMSFKVEILGFLALFITIALIPLTVFTPQLVRAKRETARFRVAGQPVHERVPA